MKKAASIILIAIISIYAVQCGLLYLFQDSLIYFPQGRAITSPESTMILSANNANLVVTTKITSGENAIIYFGGNGEDVSLNLLDFEKIFPHSSIYLMHYRSYGGSTGKPSEESNLSDANLLYETVKKNHSNITIIGRSLGSGIAVHLASEHSISSLILITPYDSVTKIAQSRFPYIPINLLLRDKYESDKYAPNIKIPTTIFMAENDTVIPSSNTENLFSRFPDGVAKLVVIHGVGHNTISNSKEYLSLLQNAAKQF